MARSRRSPLHAALVAAAAALLLGAAPAAADTTGGLRYGATSPAPAPATDPGGADPASPLPAPPGAGTVAPRRAGQVARVLSNGRARPPAGTPGVVRRMIAAANRIAVKPYVWGGGHARWEDRGYDCSGSVSYALRGGGLLDEPLVSGDLARWGERGPGSWVTIYANAGHVYMVIAGLRFDTSGQRAARTRWQAAPRSNRGFRVRHPAGL